MTINLHTDEHYVQDENHIALKKTLEESGFSVRDTRSDMTAKGGPIWFPRDFILTISELITAGFFGAIGGKAFDKLIQILKGIKENYLDAQINLESHFGMPNKIDIYFLLDTKDYFNDKSFNTTENIKDALLKIPDSQKNLEDTLANDTKGLLGAPKQIILKYDFNKKNWAITKLMSELSQDSPW